MTIKTFEQLYRNQLQVIYGAEKECKKVLTKMAKAVESPKLNELLLNEIREIDTHITRLDDAFQEIGLKPKAKDCHRIEGLIEDCMELVKEDVEMHVRDAALIATTQYVIHDEIAGYGCLRTWARLLGHNKSAQLLQKTLDELKNFDKRLTELAEKLNLQAVPVGAGVDEGW